MNAWRWFGASILVFATICLIGVANNSAAQGDDKKVSFKSGTIEVSVEAGKSVVVPLALVRGKDVAKAEVTVTAEGKGVTTKLDAKDGKTTGDEVKLTVETAAGTAAGVIKVTVTGKAAGSPDAMASVFVNVTAAPTAKQEEKKDPKQEEKKPAPVTGGQEVTFKAFLPNSKFYTIQTTSTEQKMTVLNQEVVQKQEQTFLIGWVGKDEKDKNWVVEQQIKGVKLKIDIGGNNIKYDSTEKNPKNPMTDFFDQLQKQKLTYTINPTGLSVVKVDGREDFIKGLSDINPQMRSLLNAILSDSALKKMAEPTWYAFPKDGKLAAAKEWTEKADLDLGPIGKYVTDFTFKVKSIEAGKANIDITTKLTYTAPGADKSSGLPFVIKSATLTSESGTGSAIFDMTKGRFDSSKLTMKLNGDLQIEVGSQATTVKLVQTQTSTSETKEDEPAEWKAKS